MKKRSLWIAVLLLCAWACLFAVACKKNEKEVEKAVLTTPQNLKLENDCLTWDAVENSTGYTVDINGELYETEENSLDIFALTKQPNTAYNMKVSAKGEEENYQPSDWSNSIEYSFSAANFTYKQNEQKNGYIITGIESETAKGKIVLPSKINNLPVTTIQARAFRNCAEIESVLISDSVTTIQRHAFLECTAIKRVHFGAKVNTLELPIFSQKTVSFITVSDENEKYYSEENSLIEKDRDVLAMGAITGQIPASVKTIGARAFCEYGHLQSVTIPTGIIEIREEAFFGCEALQSVKISNGVKKIDSGAFRSCYALKQVVIPDSVIEIGSSVFSTYTVVIVPDSLQKVGSFGSLYVYTTHLERPDGWYVSDEMFAANYNAKRPFFGCALAKDNEETYVYSWRFKRAGVDAFENRLVPQRTGYTFKGWALDKEGTEIVIGTREYTEEVFGRTYLIMDIQSVSGMWILPDIPYDTVLYAVWEKNA